MQRKLLRFLIVTLLLILLPTYGHVQAHQSITAGPYTIEYGWLSEPPVVGQSNAIVINISQESAAAATPQVQEFGARRS